MTFVTEKVIQRNNVIHLAGFATSLVIEIVTARRRKKEEEAKVGEEEEMIQILVREDNLGKGGTLHMQRRKVIRN